MHSENTAKDRIDKSNFRRVFDLLNKLTKFAVRACRQPENLSNNTPTN